MRYSLSRRRHPAGVRRRFNLAYAQDAGDPAAGKTVFARCAICHKVGTRAPAMAWAPICSALWAASRRRWRAFEYSGPLKASGITWTDDKLSEWVAGPAKMVPGTKMAFPGITSKADIRNVVAYLDTLK